MPRKDVVTRATRPRRDDDRRGCGLPAARAARDPLSPRPLGAATERRPAGGTRRLRSRHTLWLDGAGHQLGPQVGAFVAPGEEYEVENAGDDDLVVSVTAPLGEAGIGENRRVTVPYADQPPLPASPNREFRYLVNQDAGCLDITQFVG